MPVNIQQSKPSVYLAPLQGFTDFIYRKAYSEIFQGIDTFFIPYKQIIPVLNEFPLTEVIFHPRIAKQLYEGEINNSAFQFAENHLKHKLVYNGDIFSVDDFKNKQQLFPQTAHWMLGRGVLMNPFLPAEIKNTEIQAKVKAEKLKEFHQLIFKYYLETMDNEGNVINKMKQFWIYFGYNFTEQRKSFKLIKKANGLSKYQSAVQLIFRNN